MNATGNGAAPADVVVTFDAICPPGQAEAVLDAMARAAELHGAGGVGAIHTGDDAATAEVFASTAQLARVEAAVRKATAEILEVARTLESVLGPGGARP